MRNTKSLNCSSCGAGLCLPINNLAKCNYCGNYNKILPDGVVLTYKVQGEPPPNKKSEKSFKDLTLSQKVATALIVGLAPALALYILKGKRYQEK